MFSTLVLALISCSAPQTEPRVEVLLSNRAGDPSAAVPGFAGEEIARIHAAWFGPAGDWAAMIDTAGSFPAYRAILNGEVILSRDDPAPWLPQAPISWPLADACFDPDGNLVLVATTDEQPSTLVRHLVRYGAGGWNSILSGGDPIPGIPGTTYTLFSYLSPLENGDVAFYCRGFQAPFTETRYVHDGQQIVAEAGVDAPGAQLNGRSDPWDDWAGHYQGVPFTPDSRNWLRLGTVDGRGIPVTQLLEFNGQTVLQQYSPVPGSGWSHGVDEITDISLADDATWAATGVNATVEDAWAVLNGVVIASTGDPIVSGDARVWADETSLKAVTTDGETVLLAGVCDGGAVANSHVLVSLSDQELVILAATDPIDWDGNGLYDDGVEFHSTYDEEMAIDSLGRIICTANFESPTTGESFGALIRITIDPCVLELSRLQSGAHSRLDLARARPGSSALFAWSLAGPGPTRISSVKGPVLVDLAIPIGVSNPVTVDAQGRASFSAWIPSSMAGRMIWCQAVTVGGGEVELSQPIAQVVS